MGHALRRSAEQRRDKRAVKSGLVVEVDRQAYPVLNLSTGGLSIGEAGFGFAPGRKLFLTLSHAANPAEKAFLYGYVVWVDLFRKAVGVDFAKPSEHAYRYLEATMTSSGRRPRLKVKPRKQTGWLGRIFK